MHICGSLKKSRIFTCILVLNRQKFLYSNLKSIFTSGIQLWKSYICKEKLRVQQITIHHVCRELFSLSCPSRRDLAWQRRASLTSFISVISSQLKSSISFPNMVSFESKCFLNSSINFSDVQRPHFFFMISVINLSIISQSCLL